MTSSISSSEAVPDDAPPAFATPLPRPKGLAPAIAAIAVLLVLLEVFVRGELFRRSKDIARFETYPSLVQSLERSSGARVALFGNSTTERGVDLGLVKEAIRSDENTPVELRMFVADGSEINTWYYLIKHYFWDEGHKPDLAVMSFYGIDLDDQRPEIGRLAFHFTSLGDWPEVFLTDLKTAGDRATFAISSYWATFSARDRIRDRLLDVAIPRYKEFARRLNDDLHGHEQTVRVTAGQAPSSPGVKPTHQALRRLLDEARLRETRLVFVAVPIDIPNGGSPYEIAPEIRSLLSEMDVPLVDLRIVEGIDASLFDDDIHLNAEGRKVYSEHLGRALSPLLQTLGKSVTAYAK